MRIGSPSKAVENQGFVESHKGHHAAVNAADVDGMAGVNVGTKAARDHLRLQSCATWWPCWTSTRFTGTLTAAWFTALMCARHPAMHYTDFADNLTHQSTRLSTVIMTNHCDFSHMVSRRRDPILHWRERFSANTLSNSLGQHQTKTCGEAVNAYELEEQVSTNKHCRKPLSSELLFEHDI